VSVAPTPSVVITGKGEVRLENRHSGATLLIRLSGLISGRSWRRLRRLTLGMMALFMFASGGRHPRPGSGAAAYSSSFFPPRSPLASSPHFADGTESWQVPTRTG
jgi:hypothetical protein